jgi:dolichyl-phosphate-mannose--protein O-mannosyl transferase
MWLGGLVTVALASTLYLPHLDTPRGAVWDESYYLTAIQRQVARRAQFASHPPLGFLLLSIAPRLGPAHAQDVALAARKTLGGEAVPAGYDLARARIGSALAGVLGAAVFYALMLALVERVVLALALANLFTFENAFLVQFRAAQLDGFLMLFSLLALLAFTVSFRRAGRHTPRLDIAFGAAVGLAAMVKLIGVWLALAGPLLLWARLRSRGDRPLGSTLIDLSRSTALMSVSFLGAIALVYALQTADGARPPDLATPAGVRDQGFVSPAHAAWLEGRAPYSPGVVLAAARDDLAYVLNDLHGAPRTDPNGSSPGEWPLMRRTIGYRWDAEGASTRYVQLVGNPVGWAIGLAGLLLAPLIALGARSRRRRALALAFLILWGGVMGLHVWLAQTRVMYLYHYFPALILSWCLAALAASEALERMSARGRDATTALALAVLLHLAAFWFWSPVTFGRDLSAAGCLARNTLTVRVQCR